MIRIVVLVCLGAATWIVGEYALPNSEAEDGSALSAAQSGGRNDSFGVNVSGEGNAPNIVETVSDLGGRWVRMNEQLDGQQNERFESFLEAGVNLVITFTNQDPSNIDTFYGTPEDWPNAGFPFQSEDLYEKRVREVLEPLRPYLAEGRVWVQGENEIGDASVNQNARFWRGTIDQYLTQLEALYRVAREIDPSIRVVLTSFTSDSLDQVIDSNGPRSTYASARLNRLLSEGLYDAADLHFYGCVTDIPAKIDWVVDHMPAGKSWISTENSGPDFTCPSTPLSWKQNPQLFEELQAEQVPQRLSACVDGGGSICLWFSLLDARGETDLYNHLGLIDQRQIPVRKKPDYYAFKEFVSLPADNLPPTCGSGALDNDAGTGEADTVLCANPSPAAEDFPATNPVRLTPNAKTRVLSHSVRVTRSGVARMRLKCETDEGERCQGKLTLRTVNRVKADGKLRILTLGSRSLSIASSKTVTVKLLLSKAGQRLLRQLKRLRARAAIRADSATDDPVADERTVTLKLSSTQR